MLLPNTSLPPTTDGPLVVVVVAVLRDLLWIKLRKNGDRALRIALWHGSSSLGRKPYSELPESGRWKSPGGQGKG